MKEGVFYRGRTDMEIPIIGIPRHFTARGCLFATCCHEIPGWDSNARLIGKTGSVYAQLRVFEDAPHMITGDARDAEAVFHQEIFKKGVSLNVICPTSQ